MLELYDYLKDAIKTSYYQGQMDALNNDEEHLIDLLETWVFSERFRKIYKKLEQNDEKK